MALIRFEALKEAFTREPRIVTAPASKISEFYGCNVFHYGKMRNYLTDEVFEKVMDAIDKGTRIDRKVAGQVASGMKAWAMEHEVTHYTHWFHPLTDGTAEKHDAFIETVKDGRVVESFSGTVLAQQEPDASSFPSGGLRNTFEARGYSAWDPSSPAFIVDKTLVIPTIFVSYTGDALDSKTPLLKALNAVDKAATAVVQYFDRSVTKVFSNLGWEQEYFLIDEALFNARPDLALTGRTLMGHSSAKDQQLEDHYFASIPERVKAFMWEFEIEAYKLGIPVKTRHDEVAPNQFECAPIYEECNLAIDHNLLIMDLAKRVAKKHKFRVLYHEKPFAGINGSGKHNNWSLSTDTEINLLSPGKTPRTNTMFLTFLVNTIMAVYKHADLMRASIVSAGNAHRLGANEAPPAIISVFLGTHLSAILDEIEKKVSSKKMTPDEKTELKLDIGKIPEILPDNTDRNRTSPFAFTGNRFEFRAVGSSANCSSAMITLNTVVADQLTQFKKEVDSIIDKGVKKDEAIFQVLRKYIIECKPIRFDGNNYSDDWVKEAKKRGLSNINDVPEALEHYVSKQSLELFKRQNVLSQRELYARTEVKLETYAKKIQIESRVLGDLVMNHIVPIAIDYQTSLIKNVKGLKEIFNESEFKEHAGSRLDLIKEISLHTSYIKSKVREMIDARKEANVIEDARKKADAYSIKIAPFLDDIRYHVDKLEMIVDNEKWPLPKYRELLFTR